MPRPPSAIQAQIAALEAQIPALTLAASVQDSGRSINQQKLSDVQNILSKLYIYLDRATGAGPMRTRTRVPGLGVPPSCGPGQPVPIG